jgi:2-polyprenyl-3-methyl-5-hydroxy-6-metoxy-1,4-benzoquinol methylase/GNAT superfamily N-acetyltransferase
MEGRSKSEGSAQGTLWELEWRWLAGPEAARDRELLSSCAELFSNHYGIWGSEGASPGGHVRINVDRVAALLQDEAAWIAAAYDGERLVGYAIAERIDADVGRVAWVSQLVVHESYRKARVATTLLYSIWQFSDCYAWGLATANPFAVRALETATRRRCSIREIRLRGQQLLEVVRSHVDYLPTELDRDREGNLLPSVNTAFFLDLSDTPAMLKRAARGDRPWALGQIEDGHEWFAATFRDQSVHALDDEHLQELLLGSDGIWIQAYEGMTLDEEHAWHRHAQQEIDFIVDRAGNIAGKALDVGCGDGRHAAELARRGFEVVAIDVAPRLIERAVGSYGELAIDFRVADARKQVPSDEFDLVVCLYDVVGSSAQPDDDHRLMMNLARALRPGGLAVISVMNTGVTLPELRPEQKPESIAQFIQALEALEPSSTMETSGSVFDPSKLIHFKGIYYRKEQFDRATWRLPTELVVRDKRYSVSEIAALVGRAGLVVEDLRPVQAGRWSREPALEAESTAAKELLVFARKPDPGPAG